MIGRPGPPRAAVRRWTGIAAAAGIVVGGLLGPTAGAGAAAAPSSSTVPSGGTPISGGTVTWAELPATTPDFIYPFMPAGYFSVADVGQFQYMMYRPLYWFGTGSEPTIDDANSLADPPVFSNGDKTVTITLKDYTWSDGETVSSTDVMQWMNMWHAEKTNWAPYIPGIGMPDDVVSVTVDSPSELTIVLSGAVDPTWFTYNMLSQITPLPEAWDVASANAAPGSGKCATGAYGASTTDAHCSAVWTFMTGQAGYKVSSPGSPNSALATYATNKLWQVVDGPWRLSGFTVSGQVTMVPNPTYSGPDKPHISSFEEIPFATDAAELTSLLGGQLTMGYLPLADVSQATTDPFVAGPNVASLASSFYMVPFYPWSINYFPYNFDSTGDQGNAGKIFRQLYIRQAVQLLVDQPLIVDKVDKGYGVPTYGPVPVVAANPFTAGPQPTNPYPYNRTKAISLLRSHGWKVVPRGVDTCVSPGTGSGHCGPGIPMGATLSFTLQYATGASSQATMEAEKSSWASAGIRVTISSAGFDTVVDDAAACSSGPSCSWEMENWGAGWIFSPDYYPTGEEIFSTGAEFNYGSYSDVTSDKLIRETDFTNAKLSAYENYLSRQLPVVYQTTQAAYLWEIADDLRGVAPLNVLESNDPESYYFVK